MLVVHAGPHKTATTYIQVAYARSRRALAAKGWTYPKVGAPDALSGHHDLAHTPSLFLPQDAPRRAALAALSKRGNVVFSAEGFCRWEPSRFAELADATGAGTVEIVYAIRDPLACLRSYWAEQVKQGFSASLPERLAPNLVAPRRSRLLNPMIDLDPLLRHERLNLRVVPFDVLRADGVDIALHIADAVLGCGDVALRPQEEANVSFPVALTEFLRVLTARVAGGEARIGSDFRNAFMAVTSERERAGIAALVETDGAHARRVVELPRTVPFVESLDEMLRRRLAGLWTYPVEDRPLFPKKAVRLEHYDALSLWTAPSIRERAEEVLARIEARGTPPGGWRRPPRRRA